MGWVGGAGNLCHVEPACNTNLFPELFSETIVAKTGVDDIMVSYLLFSPTPLGQRVCSVFLVKLVKGAVKANVV